MAKFVFFGSTPKMAEYAQNYIRKTNRNDVEVLYIPSSEAAKAAEYAKELKAQIIIARGTTAAELKRSTDLPVIEIVITAQEMGILIKQAKQLIKKPKPVIAIIGASKMFCDMRDFNQIFDIELKTHFVTSLQELEAETKKAISEGADLVIGGEIVCKCASSLGVPCLRQPDGSDSIEQAFQVADSVAWAADMEKKNAVELKALLDFSSNGIIKIDKQGFILAFNNRSLSLLDKSQDELEKLNIADVLPALAEQPIFRDALIKGQEAFLTFWHTTGSALAVNVVPLLVNNVIEGAILSFHEINMLKQMEAEARRDLFQSNQTTYKFEWLPPLFSENASFLQTARNLAQHDECVLLSGSHPTEREMIARYMHDVSLRRNAPFIYLTGAAHIPEMPDDTLVSGEKSSGILLSADTGTLFIDEVEKLSPRAQHNLFRLLTDETLMRDTSRSVCNTRIIMGTQTGLAAAVQGGVFREDLYYAISALTLDIPSLQGCSDEIKNWLNYFMQQYLDTYSIYVHITKAARNAVLAHPWNGGIAELRSFCCKTVFNTPKHILDESTALRFLRQSNPYEVPLTPQKNLGLNANPEVERLKFLIEKYNGNRNMIADEMHISVTTLWRRLKKYGLLTKQD
jgi:transcriptional regulator with PAS, ATPase and Fis domain